MHAGLCAKQFISFEDLHHKVNTLVFVFQDISQEIILLKTNLGDRFDLLGFYITGVL